jgi:dTDP-4-dehydrorhamnose reductase
MTAEPPILVFGRSGQVAQDLSLLAGRSAAPLVFAGRETCDLFRADPGEVIAQMRPAAVINAAAYTGVDRAESEPNGAFRLNRDAPQAMAEACAALDIPFVHLSTDYVFDGQKGLPYVEDDPKGPLGVYGASKLAGEEAVASVGGRWTIFRTAWVFSPFSANFIKTMRLVGATRDEVAVVADQVGRPTLSADIADMALRAVSGAHSERLKGMFHLAGADDATWADVAEHVFSTMGETWGRVPALRRITTAEYPTPARRPANSRLDTLKLQRAASWAPRPWRNAVDICLAALASAPAK